MKLKKLGLHPIIYLSQNSMNLYAQRLFIYFLFESNFRLSLCPTLNVKS